MDISLRTRESGPIEFETEDNNLNYTWFPVTELTDFRIKARNDAQIALSPVPADNNQMVEIFIGGWRNQKTAICKNHSYRPRAAECKTPDILSGEKFRGFWIQWSNSYIFLGREDEYNPFLTYNDREMSFRHIGFSTGWGATGSWVLYPPREVPIKAEEPHWVPVTLTHIPQGAFVAGRAYGQNCFVGRVDTVFKNVTYPGMIVPSEHYCFVARGGDIMKEMHCDVLIGSATWVKADALNIPQNAIFGGECDEGNILYIGRVNHEGHQLIGKVEPATGWCYVTHHIKRKVHGYDKFEILVPSIPDL